jgi:hypothetical protein
MFDNLIVLRIVAWACAAFWVWLYFALIMSDGQYDQSCRWAAAICY